MLNYIKTKHIFLKYIGSGLFNTAAGYLVYVILLLWLDYKIAYTLSYIFGICLSYLLNLNIVFEQKHSMKKMIAYPAVYLVQYPLGIVLLYVFIELLSIDKYVAPIFTALAIFPLTFLITKLVLVKLD